MSYFFLAYGFVQHPFDFDAVQVTLKLKEEFAEHQTKREMLNGNKERSIHVIGNLNCQTTKDFIAFARFVVSESEDA